MYFKVINQVFVFIALSTRVLPTVVTNCRINASKNSDIIIFPELLNTLKKAQSSVNAA